MSNDTHIPSWWQVCLNLSRYILSTRSLRRKFLLSWVFILALFIFVASWPMASWLSKYPIIFFLTWAAVGVFTLFLMLFALFDIMATLREEKAMQLEARRQFEKECAELLRESQKHHDEDDLFQS